MCSTPQLETMKARSKVCLEEPIDEGEESRITVKEPKTNLSYTIGDPHQLSLYSVNFPNKDLVNAR